MGSTKVGRKAPGYLSKWFWPRNKRVRRWKAGGSAGGKQVPLRLQRFGMTVFIIIILAQTEKTLPDGWKGLQVARGD